jgi:RND family efflux transporter MFP subunit
LLRQLIISLVVIAAAAAGYVFFVPGAPEQLAKLGIVLPLPEAASAANPPAGGQSGASPQARPEGGPGRQGQGQGGAPGGRGGNRAPVIVTAPAAMGTINDQLGAIGEGAAARSATIISPAAGTLVELVAAPGEMVAAGAVIGRLDAEAEEIAYERAKLAEADAAAALARIRELANVNNATTVQVTAAELGARNAGLELQSAELALKRRTITTPIAGRVGLFQVTAGNAVTGQTVVTTVEDTSNILISFWVPERYASAVVPGMPLTASAVALPGESIAGEVTAVDNRIDPTSRTLQVQAEVPNADARLRPGMSFSVAMSFPGERFPSVDPLAIQWSSDGAFLWRYAEGKVERVPVSIIQRNSDGVLVSADLAEGDSIVVQGIQQLTPGAQVRLLDEVLGTGSQQPQGGGQG